jgi:flagellar protein FlaG
MRIDGMDASSTAQAKSIEMQPAVKVVSDNAKEIKTQKNEGRPLSQLTEFEKREMPISDKVVIEAIEKANRAISGANRRFEFSIHEKTKEIMVKVINSDTNEVVREIPPEKILDMVATMWEMAGILVDERR